MPKENENPPQPQEKTKYTLEGYGEVELTPEEHQNMLNYAAKKYAEEQAASKKPKEEKEPPKVDKKDEVEDEDRKWIKEQRAKQIQEKDFAEARKADRERIDYITKEIKADGELEGWHEAAIASVIGKAMMKKILANNTEDGQVDVKQLIKDVKEEFKAKAGTVKSAKEVKEKLKKAEETVLTAPGNKSVGQGNKKEDLHKKHGNRVFRSQDFLNEVAESTKELLKGIVE